jgi:hypothetical protein
MLGRGENTILRARETQISNLKRTNDVLSRDIFTNNRYIS